MIRQERRDDAFRAVQSTPQNVVLPPKLIEKGAKMSKRRTGEFSTAGLDFIDQRLCILRANANYFDYIRFANLRFVEHRKRDHVVIVIAFVVIQQASARGAGRDVLVN